MLHNLTFVAAKPPQAHIKRQPPCRQLRAGKAQRVREFCRPPLVRLMIYLDLGQQLQALGEFAWVM